ncbi:uncharacterized protein FOMMEDRAFT_26189 [Fomitiporia mediterranea MF3/22]|uniref:uncharacterized protein n=1 Tax=Fomitiporia mediterranea (strain MF3/22) TaxID=694068 RepID=UPI0004407CCC|nr:uncharacterized protein FOMMEDRAFT_26189 [Fomitiporia mediterranea MF3/22]EJD07081.1 hypothetical protein FOMMEDRAFT_26189 [Fomitiporia mediterranea MF3/22]
MSHEHQRHDSGSKQPSRRRGSSSSSPKCKHEITSLNPKDIQVANAFHLMEELVKRSRGFANRKNPNENLKRTKLDNFLNSFPGTKEKVEGVMHTLERYRLEVININVGFAWSHGESLEGGDKLKAEERQKKKYLCCNLGRYNKYAEICPEYKSDLKEIIQTLQEDFKIVIPNDHLIEVSESDALEEKIIETLITK